MWSLCELVTIAGENIQNHSPWPNGLFLGFIPTTPTLEILNALPIVLTLTMFLVDKSILLMFLILLNSVGLVVHSLQTPELPSFALLSVACSCFRITIRLSA